MKMQVWSLERVLFAMAGSMGIAGAALAATLSMWFLLLVGFVGASQWLFVIAGWCPASLVLTRFVGLKRGCTQ